jgi:hypothetical protein
MNKIHLQLIDNNLVIVNENNNVLFKPCENGLFEFLIDNKLTVFDVVTVKRISSLLLNTEYSYIIKYLRMNENQLLARDSENSEIINKLIKRKKLTEIVGLVYEQLKNRSINPSGNFDKKGRWWAENDQLISCREPSRRWPYPQMTACRTLKYVKKCAIYFDCKTEAQLLMNV